MTEETIEPTLTLQQLQQFFEERLPVINVSPIGEEAGLSSGHLNRILKKERPLTQATVLKLWPVLQRHGYGVPLETVASSLTKEGLQQFLEDRKRTIRINLLGEEAGISISHFHKILSGGRALSQKSIEKLLPILPKYGYQG